MKVLLVTLALAACPLTSVTAQDYAAAIGFGGPLRVYEVGDNGEITLHDQAPVGGFGEVVRVDPGGRFALCIQNPDDLDLWRIAPDRTLSLASSLEDGPNQTLVFSLALSPDSTIAMAFHDDNRLPDSERRSFRTYLINNRLQIEWTGRAMSIPEIGEAIDWTISPRGGWTAVVNLGPLDTLAILSLSPSGVLIDTGNRVATTGLHGNPLRLSADGRWLLTGSQAEGPSVALYEIDPFGMVSLHDSTSVDGGSTFEVRFRPDLSGVVTANDGMGLSSVDLDENVEFGDLIDSESPGLDISEALDINHDNDLVLFDDQGGGGFTLYSFFIDAIGELTPTGFSLTKGFKLEDIQFIPDLTPPTIPGDANLDGRVDAADVVFLVNEAMPDDKPILLPPNFANADLDGDVDVDEDDLQALVDLLLDR
jgi:hypothetical protein